MIRSLVLDPKYVIEHDKECRIEAARILNEIADHFLAGRGVQRFRAWQNSLMRYSMVIVTSGLLSYDKLIEKITSLEAYLGEHGGNDASAQLDPQERLKAWLNGSDSDEGEAIQ